MITMKQSANGYAVMRLGERGEIIAQVRFQTEAEVLDFASLWREWLEPEAVGTRAA